TQLRPEKVAGATVHRTQAQLLVESEHACGKVGEDALEIRLGLRQLRLVPLGLAARLGELQRHAVERLGEHPDLVTRDHRRAPAEVPTRHGASTLHERTEWCRQSLPA